MSTLRSDVICVLDHKQSELGKGQVDTPVLVSPTIGITYDCQNYGLYSMYRSLQYVIFTSCNVVLRHIYNTVL